MVLALDPPQAAAVREVFARALRVDSTRAIARWLDTLPVQATGGMELGRAVVWWALSDDQTWAALDACLATPLAGRGTGRYLLSSFLRCARCGARASKRASGPRGRTYPFYGCNRCDVYLAPLPLLDRLLVERVRRVLVRDAAGHARAARAAGGIH